VVTRDRNRIALISDCLGARALGIRNLLCTSGTHQTLGRFHKARNVFDVDSIQLLQAYTTLGSNASLVGEESLDGASNLCLGAVATPYADPMEMQVTRLAKKVAAGARFLITQSVFDVERFDAWLVEVTKRGIHEKVALIAGIRPLAATEGAKALAEKRPAATIPQPLIERLESAGGEDAQRAEGLKIAVETIRRLSTADGLRGFQICVDRDADAALQVIESSGLGTE